MDERQAYWLIAALSAVENVNSSGPKFLAEPVSAGKLVRYFGGHQVFESKESIDTLLEKLSLHYFEKRATPYALPRYVPGVALTEAFFGANNAFDEMAIESGIGELWADYRQFGNDWLFESIEGVGSIASVFGTVDGQNNGSNDEWEPLKVDYDSPLAESSIADLETAVDAIQNDNGYSTAFPEERESVVRSLRDAISYMRMQGIYTRIYFKHSIVVPLSKAISRLGGNAAGKLAESAFKGLQKWVTEFVFNLLS
ncbi:MAG: hypothetical protein NXH70_16950 [Hyphomonas sp.]|nr:hypothetical protein [Hyphomonas sp.]